MTMLSSRDWVTSIQRLCWGVVHLSGQPWLSVAEKQSLTDLELFAAQLLGDGWERFAGPALVRDLAAAVKDVGARGEGAYLARWFESGVTVCRLIFDQRRADLDAQLVARQSELDAVWDRTVVELRGMTDDAVNNLCRAAGDLVAGAGEAAGRGFGAFLAGVLQSPVAIGALVVGAWVLFGKGGRK